MSTKKAAAASKRKTAPAAPAVKIATCDEADRRGLELGQARLEREALQNEIHQKKNAIDLEYAERLEELATTENTLQVALDAFAAKHKRAEDLNYVEIVSTGGGLAISYDVDEADVIKQIKRSKVWAHLVKFKEFLNKRDLQKIPRKLHGRFGFQYGPTAVTYSVVPKLDAVRTYAEREAERSKRTR
jgi:hypothetical protein